MASVNDMYENYRQGKAGHKLEIVYFDGRGRGEGVRFLLAAGGIPYTDTRLQLGSDQWKEMKPSTPYGCVPVLKAGQVTLAESVAIGSFVAHLAGLAGDDFMDQAKILSLVLQSNEFREELARIMYLPCGEEEKAKEMENFLTGKAAFIMNNLEKALGEEQFLVKSKLSFADIWFYHCVELLLLGAGKADFLTKWSKLQSLYKRVAESPCIAQYLKDRRHTAF